MIDMSQELGFGNILAAELILAVDITPSFRPIEDFVGVG